MTDAILSVPNYGYKTKGKFEKLPIEFNPDAPDLTLEPDGQKLTMNVGDARLRLLTAALADVEIGRGDFGIRTSDNRKSDPWMFWWMPAI